MVAAKVLADDGNYRLRFVKSRQLYIAGCREFTAAETAITHWERRSKEPFCEDDCQACRQIRDRAKLFLKAITKHAAEQSQ